MTKRKPPPWNEATESELERLFKSGDWTLAELAEWFERTPAGIEWKLIELGLVPRRKTIHHVDRQIRAKKDAEKYYMRGVDYKRECRA